MRSEGVVFITKVAEVMTLILLPLSPTLFPKPGSWSVSLLQAKEMSGEVRAISELSYDFAFEHVQTWSQQCFIMDNQIAKNF